MINKQLIIDAVNEALADPSWFLVDVSVTPDNIIAIEIDNDTGVSIDDCARLSRFVESRLNRDEEDFELEVGSAGLTSPFKIPRQYAKNRGNEVETLTKDGRKLYGILKDSDDNGFVLTIAKQVKPEGAKRKVTVEEDLTFGYDEVKYTKYLIRFK
ncbi:MAG: ribosome assembly cofactor RimP [Prevotella sp.]|jgi:ribosome maturation factor RimP|nr:ribosome assembly cofactor RimP [Prevotella sp.]